MTGKNKTRVATKSKEKAFINATSGLRGLIASMVRPVLGIPEPKHQQR